MFVYTEISLGPCWSFHLANAVCVKRALRGGSLCPRQARKRGFCLPFDGVGLLPELSIFFDLASVCKPAWELTLTLPWTHVVCHPKRNAATTKLFFRELFYVCRRPGLITLQIRRFLCLLPSFFVVSGLCVAIQGFSLGDASECHAPQGGVFSSVLVCTGSRNPVCCFFASCPAALVFSPGIYRCRKLFFFFPPCFFL